MKRNLLLLICIITTMTMQGDQQHYTQSDTGMPKKHLEPTRTTSPPYKLDKWYIFDPDNRAIKRTIAYEKSEFDDKDTALIRRPVRNVWVSEVVPIEGLDYDSVMYTVGSHGISYTIYSEEKIKELSSVKKIDPPQKGLKHFRGKFFYKKDGLYYYDNSNGLKKLEDNDGNEIVPIMKGRYFLYGNNVFSFGSSHRLLLQPDKIKEFDVKDIEQRFLITDGSHIYDAQKHYGYNASNSESLDTLYFKEFYGKDIEKWQQLTDGFYLIQGEKDGKTVRYIPSFVHRFSGTANSEILVKAPDCFYTFKQSYWDGVTKVDQVYIFNYDLGDYEEIDTKQFRFIGKGFYVYKKRLYLNGHPVKEEVNTDKLNFINTKDGLRTDFLYDEQSIIYTNFGGSRSIGEGAKTLLVLENSMVRLENPPTHEELSSIIRIGSKSVLWDSEYIYYGFPSELIIIPQIRLQARIFFSEIPDSYN